MKATSLRLRHRISSAIVLVGLALMAFWSTHTPDGGLQIQQARGMTVALSAPAAAAQSNP